MKARRVVIYRDVAGKWRFKAQGGNWRTIGASEQGLSQKRSIRERVAREYPDVPVVEL